MAEKFDAIILGMGLGGEVVAGRLLAAGKKVAVGEKELLGGDCAYWACIPSKTPIRPPEARNEATRVQGIGTPILDLKDVLIHRACWAIHTRTSVDTLLEGVLQFPTFSQGYLVALEQLDL